MPVNALAASSVLKLRAIANDAQATIATHKNPSSTRRGP